jgi:hypothetical protein
MTGHVAMHRTVGGNESIMAEMPILTGSALDGKAKRWGTTKPEGKISVLQLVNGCYARGCAQVHGRWQSGVGVFAPVAPQEPNES